MLYLDNYLLMILYLFVAIILIFVLFLRVKYGSNDTEEDVEIVEEKVYDTYNSNKPRRNKKHELLNSAYEKNKKLEIKYKKKDGTITTRVIRVIKPVYYDYYGRSNGYYIRAFCYLRNEERIFKVSRILEIKDIEE